MKTSYRNELWKRVTEMSYENELQKYSYSETQERRTKYKLNSNKVENTEIQLKKTSLK